MPIHSSILPPIYQFSPCAIGQFIAGTHGDKQHFTFTPVQNLKFNSCILHVFRLLKEANKNPRRPRMNVLSSFFHPLRKRCKKKKKKKKKKMPNCISGSHFVRSFVAASHLFHRHVKLFNQGLCYLQRSIKCTSNHLSSSL